MRFLAIFFILFTLLDAKDKEFYYSFIDSNGKQISSKIKESIIKTLDELEDIKQIVYSGELDDALQRLTELKSNNKLSLLNSDILVLYSELALKKPSKKILLETSIELENAINSSLINQEDLLKAYLFLIELKLKVNKVEDARYYAQTVIDIFDDEEAKAKGKIAIGRVFKYQKDYSKASKILYEVLRNTKDINVVSITGNELFDIYLLEDKKDDAKKIMKQLLDVNPSFFSKDFALAEQRADLLLKFDEPLLAVKILESLVQTPNKSDALEKVKFKLANIYMDLYDKTDLYLNLAKQLYKNLTDDYPRSKHFNTYQMNFDEIQMRQRLVLPNVISEKYIQDETMQKKALLQELINNNLDKNFEEVVTREKVYKDIPQEILKRFAFDNIDELLDITYKGLIGQYLEQENCAKLSLVLQDTKPDIFNDLLKRSNKLKDGLIKCSSSSYENYSKLKEILEHFAFNDINASLDTSYINFFKEYLKQEDCEKLNISLKDINYNTFKEIIKDDRLKNGLIKCVTLSYENYTKLKDFLKKFAFSDIDEFLDTLYIRFVKDYLEQEECIKLSYILKDGNYNIFKEIFEDNRLKDGLIRCISGVPSYENYTKLKDILKDEQDLYIYLILEAMALSVDNIEDALYFSSKIEKSGDKNILNKEFLYKYQALKVKNDRRFDKFFLNALKNQELIQANQEEPIIIDFYYDFYLYLSKENKEIEALKILNALYDKQKELNVHIYSPFVELELSRFSKQNEQQEDALNYLEEAFKNARKLKAEDEIRIYYDSLKLYDTLGNKEKKDEYLQKCKDIKVEEDNFYKKMCMSFE